MRPALPLDLPPAPEAGAAPKPAGTKAATPVADTVPQTSGPASVTHPWHQDFQHIACPFCHGSATGVISLFGGNAGEVLMQCRDCSTAFHWIKWQGKLPPHPSTGNPEQGNGHGVS